MRIARLWKLVALASVTALLLPPAVPGGASAATGSRWYKSDLHVHSVFSAEGFPDLGILTRAATAAGFNAIFLSDHDLGSNFHVSWLTANRMKLDDTLINGYFRRWKKASHGSLTSSSNGVATSPAKSGTYSLHLASSSTSAGETFAWTKRGPNLRAATGGITVSFSVYPVALDPGSGLYVSASIGGDPTIKEPRNNPIGYTTADGTVSPGKSAVLVWYLGAPPPDTLYPGAKVYPFPLGSHTFGAWNTYTIDVRNALAQLPAADQPLDHNALRDLKIAAVANGGSAEAYFDAYTVEAPSAAAAGASLAADEFVYRNGLLAQYDVPDKFSIFPSVELGTVGHTNRFNFGITDPSEFVYYWDGTDGIRATQATGYPAQLNHPGVDGGISDARTVSTIAEGADLLEVRQQRAINDWDAILRQNPDLPPLGTWGTDNHIGSWSGSAQATYIRAPALTFDALMRALYEGRAYLGQSNLSGALAFNLDPASSEPYPARYPVYVPASGSSANVHLAITGGLRAGSDVIRWLSNGGSDTRTSVIASETAGAISYSATKSIPVGKSFTYVRVEVRTASGALKAMSQPIMFQPRLLPDGFSVRVEGVDTPNGRGYTKLATKGITSGPGWTPTSAELALTLTNPAGSLADLRIATGAGVPRHVAVDDAAVPAAASLADFTAANGSTWYFDARAGLLYLKASHTAATANVSVAFDPGTFDTTPPSAPPAVTATDTTDSTVSLSWQPSSDDTAVAGYNVYIDGVKAGAATPMTSGTSYVATRLACGTSHTFAVEAADTSGNISERTATTAATSSCSGFRDNFEAGNLEKWTTVSGLVVDRSLVHSGSVAARATSTSGTPRYAYKQLTEDRADVYYRIWFQIVRPGDTVNLLKLRTATGKALAAVYASAQGRLGLKNEVTATTIATGGTLRTGTWHSVELHASVNGSSGSLEAWLDGVRVSSTQQNLGTTPIRRLQLGENLSDRMFDVAFDDVAADIVPLSP